MSVKPFPLPPLAIDRRQLLIGGSAATAGLLLPSLGRAQTHFSVTEGNVAPSAAGSRAFEPADGAQARRIGGRTAEPAKR